MERGADRKALKRAYFELASKLHPDRYFRKRLGSYKQKLEAIFSRITQAHDILGNERKRAEYDVYLEEKNRSRSIEDLLEDALAEVKRAEARAEKEASDAEAAASSGKFPAAPAAGGPSLALARPPAPSTPVAASPAPEPSPPPSPLPPRPSAPPASGGDVAASAPPGVDRALAARREALAARLLGGRRSPSGPQVPVNAPAPVPQGSRPPAGPPPVPSASDAMAMLRRRYEERRSAAKATQARAYLAKGREAMAAGDAVGAASHLRVAASLSPGDAELERMAREAQAKADEIMAGTYEKQAAYEERNGQWIEAARSWGRVCRCRPGDASANERGANAIMKAGGDLHEAGRLAQRAVSLEPQSPAFRTTLANVYLAAGLNLNARRELESAAQLAPQDGTIQSMLKRVGKPT